MGWGELLIVGIIALIFLGPKDIPVVLGFCMRSVRRMKQYVAYLKEEVDRFILKSEVDKVKETFQQQQEDLAHALHAGGATKFDGDHEGVLGDTGSGVMLEVDKQAGARLVTDHDAEEPVLRHDPYRYSYDAADAVQASVAHEDFPVVAHDIKYKRMARYAPRRGKNIYRYRWQSIKNERSLRRMYGSFRRDKGGHHDF